MVKTARTGLAKPARTKTEKCRIYFLIKIKTVERPKASHPKMIPARSRRSVLCPPRVPNLGASLAAASQMRLSATISETAQPCAHTQMQRAARTLETRKRGLAVQTRSREPIRPEDYLAVSADSQPSIPTGWQLRGQVGNCGLWLSCSLSRQGKRPKGKERRRREVLEVSIF